MVSSEGWQRSVALHGHACCLLAVGYRAAETALAELKRLGMDLPELAAVVENRTCGVDGVQAVCQATPGNGRLLILDRGKYVFTVGSPRARKGVRISLLPGILSQPGPEFVALMEKVANAEASEGERSRFYELQEPLMRYILEADSRELFNIAVVDFSFSRPRLSLFTVRCGECGEEVAQARAVRQGERWLCESCQESQK